jgi:hypothetical protein
MKRKIDLSGILTNPKVQRRGKSALFGHYPEAEIELVINWLNDYSVERMILNDGRGKPKMLSTSEVNKQFRQLVREWKESGPNLNRFFHNRPELWLRCARGRADLVSTNTGRAYVSWSPAPAGKRVPTAKDIAIERFQRLIVNPLWESLGGPCPRCDKYYRKKEPRQKVFCSSNCNRDQSAEKYTKLKRAKDWDLKLKRAGQGLEDWIKMGSQGDWKRSVQKTSGVSLHFLTRAANTGRLKVPG